MWQIMKPFQYLYRKHSKTLNLARRPNSNFSKVFGTILLLITFNCYAEEYIQVNKNGVLHNFVRVDEPTDYFTQNVFPWWEGETFEIFDQVKDDQSIAIDIGAWIGTTAIWLSKHFHQVIAVEADRRSVEILTKNLAASGCTNVTICPKPVTKFSQEVIFGPRGGQLNESVSYVKTQKDSVHDYVVKSSTFQELILDYVYVKCPLGPPYISFIKCDIEGGEEEILEEILHFVYYNNCKAYISFHIAWWKSKNIKEFAHWFRLFKTNCPVEDVCEYLQENPFASLLFERI